MISTEDYKENKDSKCEYHSTFDILFLCYKCKLEPCCAICISGKGNHYGHKVDIIDETNILPLVSKFKNETYKSIQNKNKEDQSLLIQSNSKFESIESDNKNNIALVQKEFQILHRIIQILETDILNQLKTTFEENKLINATIDSTIESNNKLYSNITNNNETISKLNNFNNNNNNNNTTEIIKKYQQSLSLLKNNDNSNNSNIDIGEKLKEYKNHIISFNQKEIEKIKESLKLISSFNNSNNKKNNNVNNNNNNNISTSFIEHFIEFENGRAYTKDLGRFKNNPYKFYILQSTSDVNSTYNDNMAIGPNIDLSKFKISCSHLMLMNGFNTPLTPGLLPDSIKWLNLCAIKTPLVKGSIPKSVREISLNEGFDTLMSKEKLIELGIIGRNVTVYDERKTINKPSQLKLS